MCDGDPQPGEKVLQDIRERRGQERRLQEIQEQLEILGQSQEMTVSSKQLIHTHTHTTKHMLKFTRVLSALTITALLRASIRRHVCDKLLQAHSSFTVIHTGGR